jgi:DNA-binding transcriptional regulator GbsR (MarR family)
MAQEPFDAADSLFIRRWGEMGATWGISRTMAEVHALLYLATEALCTDDIMDRLAISRGSASMNLRELENWGLIQRLHRRGDRKEYFEAERDVWQMFETIMRERRRREVLPIMETIERCITMVDEGRTPLRGQVRKAADEYRKKYTDILEFCEMMNTMFNLMSKAGRTGVKTLAKQLGRFIR